MLLLYSPQALSSYYLLRRQHQQQAQRLNQILYGHGCAAGNMSQPSSCIQQQHQWYQQSQLPAQHQQQLVQQQRQPLQSLQPGGTMAWEAAAPGPEGSAGTVAAAAVVMQQQPCRKRSADGSFDAADAQERGKRRVLC